MLCNTKTAYCDPCYRLSYVKTKMLYTRLHRAWRMILQGEYAARSGCVYLKWKLFHREQLRHQPIIITASAAEQTVAQTNTSLRSIWEVLQKYRSIWHAAMCVFLFAQSEKHSFCRHGSSGPKPIGKVELVASSVFFFKHCQLDACCWSVVHSFGYVYVCLSRAYQFTWID